MKVIRGTRNLDKIYPNPILTLGNFDGVHIGHTAIFKEVINRAKEVQGTSIVFTFEPHPLKLLAPDKSPPLLTTFHKKMELIRRCGIDVAICAHFTRKFAEQRPRDFARDIILSKTSAKEIFVGHDYAFGRGREGNISYLQKMGREMGFKVNIIEPIKVDGKVVSSSIIRNMIMAGEVDNAAKFLGRFYSIEGKVVKGLSIGSIIGYHTANIDTIFELLPCIGVYAVKVLYNRTLYHGIANIGYNPTFNRDRLAVEVHIFDFNRDIYYDIIEVYFIKYLREERVFKDMDELRNQIKVDIEKAKEVLANYKREYF